MPTPTNGELAEMIKGLRELMESKFDNITEKMDAHAKADLDAHNLMMKKQDITNGKVKQNIKDIQKNRDFRIKAGVIGGGLMIIVPLIVSYLFDRLTG